MLTFSKLRKRFGAVQALYDCSFSVVETDSGEILWDGRSVRPEDRLRKAAWAWLERLGAGERATAKWKSSHTETSSGHSSPGVGPRA